MRSYVGSLLALGAAATFALSGCATATSEVGKSYTTNVPASATDAGSANKKYDLNDIWYFSSGRSVRIEQTDNSFAGYRMEDFQFHPKGFRLITGSILNDGTVYCYVDYPFGGSKSHVSQISNDGNSFYCAGSAGRFKLQRAQ